ncbi:MAG: polyribonucleotide nucleotidyltransferase [Nitrospirota bacterium]
MEPKTATMDLAGREFKITNSPISTYATGYAVVSLGDTIVMANTSMSEKGKEGAEYFPMFVDYEEPMYAAGKIKGSRFVKREGRPSENAVLIGRLIDRPIRPLFPKGTTNEVQIICTTLSADLEVDPGTTAMNAASMALLLSGAPFEGPIGAVRMGYKDGKLIVNPTHEETDEGILNLIVAGTLDAITMVEAAAKEVTEEVLLEALELAHKHIKEICQFQIDYAAQFDIKKIEAEVVVPDEGLVEKVAGMVSTADLDGIVGPTKMEVKSKLHAIEEKVFEAFAEQIEADEVSKGTLAEIVNKLFEKQMRKNILEKETRIDGRKLDEVRKISVFLDVLPRAHGSAIFQRGETASLSITTLGGPGDAQIVDTMESDLTKRYFHHYNFPPYAVGDIKMLRGASRRDIGHGDLGERAIVPVLPDEKEFGYTIWVNSQIIKCNGSSSMAGTCGSTLSLMAAGVPIKRPVAGIAMGLVSDGEKGIYKVLSDIQGMEDFAGDMDFKVTGTSEGITALQMDIKIKGLSTELMKQALDQAKQGRAHIMDEMLKVIPEPRKELSSYAPLIMTIQIDPEKIGAVIGKGGETIQEITKECEVEIDIADDGLITVTAPDQEKGKKAEDWIAKITYEPKAGEIFEGKVVKIMEFGAFVEFLPGKDGLVHISKLSKDRVNKVEDVVKEGDKVKVKLMEVDAQGRYNLSMKDAIDSPVTGGDAPAPKKDDLDKPQGAKGEPLEGTQSVREV